jgi:hypothetical protein
MHPDDGCSFEDRIDVAIWRRARAEAAYTDGRYLIGRLLSARFRLAWQVWQVQPRVGGGGGHGGATSRSESESESETWCETWSESESENEKEGERESESEAAAAFASAEAAIANSNVSNTKAGSRGQNAGSWTDEALTSDVDPRLVGTTMRRKWSNDDGGWDDGGRSEEWDEYRLPWGWQTGHTPPPNGVNPLPLDGDRAAGGEDVCGIVARRLQGGHVWLLVRLIYPPLAWVAREAMVTGSGTDSGHGLEWCGGPKVLTAFETEHGMVTADRYAFGAEQGSVTFTPREWDRGPDRHTYSYATLNVPKLAKKVKQRSKKKAQTAPSGGEAGAAAQFASS